MSERIEVTELGRLQYGVAVTEGQDTTHHRVTVSEQLLDQLLLEEDDGARLVHEAVAYLMEDEHADAIPEDFVLSELIADHEDFLPEMRDRLG
jgi:hypothetical protein